MGRPRKAKEDTAGKLKRSYYLPPEVEQALGDKAHAAKLHRSEVVQLAIERLLAGEDVQLSRSSEEADEGILTEEVRNALEDVIIALQTVLERDNAAQVARHQVHADTGGDTQDTLGADSRNRRGTSHTKTG